MVTRMLLTLELANQCALKALFACVVYISNYHYNCNSLRVIRTNFALIVETTTLSVFANGNSVKQRPSYWSSYDHPLVFPVVKQVKYVLIFTQEILI